MYSEKKHIIEKVLLEVTASDEKEAHRIHNNASVFAQEKLFPVLEELFDTYDNGAEIIRFDRLDIDFSINEWEDTEALKFELLKNLKKKIDFSENIHVQQSEVEESIKTDIDSKQRITIQESKISTFLFFIENGTLPWFGKQEYISDLSDKEKWIENLAQKDFLSSLKNILKNNKNAVDRLVFQFSDELVLELLLVLNRLKIKDKIGLLHYVGTSKFNFINCLMRCMILMSLQPGQKQECLHRLLITRLEDEQIKEPTEAVVRKQVKEFTSEMQLYFANETVAEFFTISKGEIRNISKIKADAQSGKGPNDSANSHLEKKPTISKEEFVSDEKELPFFYKGKHAIVVQKAGLVLLGPFLPPLFKAFNWISENDKIREEAKLKAVQALHFLATGNDVFFEGNLIFEKFLCGVALNTPIPKSCLLSHKVVKECDNLLRQVIKYWQALKNTGPDGLRQMFIERDGKLIQKEHGFKLIVERKVQDILLDKLQWNISLIKLPWKDDLLFVEW
ncbi:contractile injection system tape measure protein [Prolixibacteraceae bacterium Z1-6]|uniref:Contractile injection system tape measure protein n=1 Tax=Draconibacterium aestuarii TaxID=2998507 RepID=A0A9X3FAI7_9BACT|nr:contractile injection system tape measure protein [Prolixibacteraceae bacterium Z1-6]